VHVPAVMVTLDYSRLNSPLGASFPWSEGPYVKMTLAAERDAPICPDESGAAAGGAPVRALGPAHLDGQPPRARASRAIASEMMPFGLAYASSIASRPAAVV